MLGNWFTGRKERKLEPVLRKSLAMFHHWPDQDDYQLVRLFTSEGIKRSLANRILFFVPVAYCRALYEPKGVKST